MKRSFLQILFCLTVIALSGWYVEGNILLAQEVEFKASGPGRIENGQRFRFTYTVNQQGTNLKPGKMDDFQVLSGPNSSTSSSIQVINGNMTQSLKVSYTYILQAKKEGTFTIPSGSITVEGKKYNSNPVTIKVVKARSGQANANSRSNGGNGSNRGTPAAGLSKDDLFLRMVVSKSEVRKGEPIIATLKLYTRVNLANLGSFKAPAYNGFWSETLQEARNLNFQRETIKGEVYNTAVVQQHVLIPERSGTLQIEPAELTAIAQVASQRQRRRRSLFDNFFGAYENVERLLKSPTLNIKVKELPGGAPAGYAEAVGNIRLSAVLDPPETKTNEAVSLKVTYSGTGNLKLIGEPKIKFPTDFEVYDPKISNSYSASSKGFSGSKSYEYLLIPRHEGYFEIPAISFTVFDLESNQYKTQTAGPFPVQVAKGEGEAVTAIDLGTIKEDVQQLGTDIRYIRTDNFELREKDRPFFGSASFYLSYALSLGAFVLSMFFVGRKRRQSEDVVYMKNKKAAKVAQSRLKEAKNFMEKGEREPFYRAVLDAQWGYISDKLNIPTGELNKEKIQDQLESKAVEPSLVKGYIDLMNRCEFAQFAPGGGEDELSSVYAEAERLIKAMESNIK